MNKKYQEGDKVELTILRETDLGFVALVNNADEGLLYHDQVFEKLNVGQSLPGYVRKYREDGKLDLILQPLGNFGTEDLAKFIISVLNEHGGFLALTKETPAEEIYNLFGVSKKKYKMAIGLLYKTRTISVSEQGIRLLK